MSPPRSGRHGIVAFKKVRKCENKCENEKKISSFCSCFASALRQWHWRVRYSAVRTSSCGNLFDIIFTCYTPLAIFA